MEMKPTKLALADGRRGSALIMVVVLTVLLAVIGVLFVMASRIDEMATSSVVYDHELDHAVDSVVELISQRLADDLTGASREPWDYPDINDSWLGVIEPNSLDNYLWREVSDLTDDIRAAGWIGLFANIYSSADANDVIPADADGDGVTDSFWIRLPDVTTGRGKPVFAAVRIVDNCGMLNLNTAHLSVDLFNGQMWPPGTTDGRFLSTVDYQRFLRGADLDPIGAGPNDYSDQYSILRARRRDGVFDPLIMDTLQYHEYYHNNAIMRIENPGPEFSLFDISDELEIRNRFMLTSLFQARFEREDVAYQTFDWGRGFFVGGWQTELKVKRIPFTMSDFNGWQWRLDANNFDDTSGGALVDEWKYDRRHVCTFYSFDRNLRLGYYRPFDFAGNPVMMIFEPDPWAVCTNIAEWDPTIPPAGGYNYNNIETHVKILKLLYAFRAYYLEKYPSEDFKRAAQRAAQLVANMIDYVDDDNTATQGPFFDAVYGLQTNDNPTYIDRNVIWQLIWDVSGYLSGGLNAIDIDVDTQYDFGIGITDPSETIYGYERQPFISEICRKYDRNNPLIDYYAIELCNPYTNPNGTVNVEGWRIKIGAYEHIIVSTDFIQGTGLEVEAATFAGNIRILGRAVIASDVQIVNPRPPVNIMTAVGMQIGAGEIVELQRPDPANPGEFITVDRTEPAQAASLFGGGPVWRSSKRDDSEWKFANQAAYRNVNSGGSSTLGQPNNVNVNKPGSEGYQIPIPNRNVPIGTLHDFEMVLTVGNEKDPNDNTVTVTEHVAAASDEGDIRTDIAPVGPNRFIPPIYPLDYICFVGRREGTLPGRINVNTATKEVIRAAIPPDAGVIPDYEALAAEIVQYRDGSPLQRITDLLDVAGFDQFTSDPNGVGDPDMRDDFEERDWILSRVANKLTVRSDVFTAYILVRLGHDGPERRMIAIFDRSNVYQPIGNNKPEKPRIIALHPVPDPR